ncbi:MAG TPA: RNA polymerase sigma factor [Gemmatimonas sp.]|uniref:RNA polymerase sigma factor n=1 Tax=Gemmatimonas sp. TaxID=1962908 RepID=UPI002EDB3905
MIDPVVRAAQDGDAAAFAQLYDQHATRLFALALGLTGDRQMAEELVQDGFVRAWERLTTFRGDCAFSTWLHRVTVNVLLVNERSRKRRALRVAIASDLADGRDGPSPPLDAPLRAPDVALSMDLEAAVSRLPAGARAVFVMHDVAGYAHAEIANQLGIAEGTSKAHLFRARRLLRGMLDR